MGENVESDIGFATGQNAEKKEELERPSAEDN